jgi:uncharacterized protein
MSTEFGLQVLAFLREHPEFFDEHAELFASLTVPNPHGGRAVSLIERQLMAVKEKNKQVELRLAELIRIGRENEVIVDKFTTWTRSLVAARHARDLPGLVEGGVGRHFTVPLTALRLWGVMPEHQGLDAARPVADDVKSFAHSLMGPYCGSNSGFAAASWLPGEAASIALLPLRVGAAPEAFGLLVLGSPDPQRFRDDMGVEMLARIAEICSAALARLLPESGPAVAAPVTTH